MAHKNINRYEGHNFRFKSFYSIVLTGKDLNLPVLEEGEGGEVVDPVGFSQPLVVDLHELDVELLGVVVDRLELQQRGVASRTAPRIPLNSRLRYKTIVTYLLNSTV